MVPEKRSTEQLVPFLTDLEKIARPLGFHVALTGSSLYGMGTGKDDVDVVVYPIRT